MPELPEVETIRRELAAALMGEKISEVKIFWPKLIRPFSVKKFTDAVTGQKIVAVNRRAKILMLELTGGDHLLIHLKMTGQIIFRRRQSKLIVGGHPQQGGMENLPNKYTRAQLTFSSDAELFFNDLRKFGWWKLLDSKSSQAAVAHLGEEPLGKAFTLPHFISLLERYPKRKIKQLLLDQTLIAGIGNIYADEACFYAHVLPTRAVKTLNKLEQQKLHEGIIKILKLSIFKKGTSSRNYVRANGQPGGFVPHLMVYGREGERCKRCLADDSQAGSKAKISKIKVSGRGTHFCQNCQK
jgi:formamidopyrimidine-DNA glycosylase